MSEAAHLKRPIIASNFHAINKGAVIGRVDIAIPAWHIKITCLWLRSEKGEFLSMPSEKFTDRNGKTVYRRLVEFTDKEAADRFQAAALAAAKRLSGLIPSDASFDKKRKIPEEMERQDAVRRARDIELQQQRRAAAALAAARGEYSHQAL